MCDVGDQYLEELTVATVVAHCPAAHRLARPIRSLLVRQGVAAAAADGVAEGEAAQSRRTLACLAAAGG